MARWRPYVCEFQSKIGKGFTIKIPEETKQFYDLKKGAVVDMRLISFRNKEEN